MDKYFGTLKSSTRDIPKRPGKLTNGVLFYQDNAPAHKYVVAMLAMLDCGFEVVDHPPYSPDLTPSDYFLFPNIKKRFDWEADLAWKQSRTNYVVISAVEFFVED